MTKHPIIRLITFVIITLLLTGFNFPGFEKSPKRSHRQASQQAQEHREYSSQPRHIALLLPFTGNHAEAARAIREGFMASYYESAFPGAQRPTVRVYDTSKEQDVQRIYQAAIEQGADFVVGPLTKEDVLRLSELSPRATSVPILALNYHPNAHMAGRMTQFSLLPESEAEQLAQKAWQQGYQRASIIVSDNSWGRRIASTFIQRWQLYGGQIVHTIFANPADDQATAARHLLGVSDNPKIAATQRPDLDVIIMAADPQQARQLKPLFDFYYADKIPVYATSTIYSGHPNPGMDHDLNGVIFCDMPWLVDAVRGQEIERLLVQYPGKDVAFNRLFAMGVDAYHLTSELNKLQSGNAFAGATGNLSINHQLIQRNLAWAKIVNGMPASLDD